MSEPIYVVIAGPYVLGVYRSADSAELHKRCVTGARVVASEILSAVPPEILDDLVNEFDSDQDDDTPVVPLRLDDIDSGPASDPE